MYIHVHVYKCSSLYFSWHWVKCALLHAHNYYIKSICTCSSLCISPTPGSRIWGRFWRPMPSTTPGLATARPWPPSLLHCSCTWHPRLAQINPSLTMQDCQLCKCVIIFRIFLLMQQVTLQFYAIRRRSGAWFRSVTSTCLDTTAQAWWASEQTVWLLLCMSTVYVYVYVYSVYACVCGVCGVRSSVVDTLSIIIML